MFTNTCITFAFALMLNMSFWIQKLFCNSNSSNVLVLVYLWIVYDWRVEKGTTTEKDIFIDSSVSRDQVITLLGTVQSDNEDEIDELINDFDKEFIASEEMKLTKLEANDQVVDQRITHIKDCTKDTKDTFFI